MAEPRHPGQVDDPDAGPYQDVGHGADTDADGRPDTIVLGDGVDLVLLTDLDGDGYADRVLRIGPDGVAREVGHRPVAPRDNLVSGAPGGTDGAEAAC
jgi:hypothetical protein